MSKFRPTENRWNRALFTGQKQTKFRLPLKLSLLRGSRPKLPGPFPTFGSHCSRFHPNRYTIDRVIAERVKAVVLPHRLEYFHDRLIEPTTRWLYCVEWTQYSVGLEAVRYMQQVFPWAHPIPRRKRLLDRFSCFFLHGQLGDRPTDRPTDITRSRSVTIGGVHSGEGKFC